MKQKLSLLVVLMSFSLVFSQNKLQQLTETYLNKKGEITFTFKVKSQSDLLNLSNQLSIVNFDKQTKTVKAWANQRQFNAFLERNIPYNVHEEDNEIGEVVMTSEIHNRANTLTFPLTAYPTYADYAQQMADFAADNPTICELVDIGGTGEGVGGGDKRLLFIKLSDNVSSQEQEPRVMYTSSMHGDEIAGFPMMLNLIDYFITTYNNTGHPDHLRIKDLIDNSEVWINPLANPDGTYYNSASNTTVANARRGNVNGLDLNRNYPDPSGVLHPDGQAFQVETLNFMALAESTHFVISANFHGGTEVVNYPWDYSYDRHPDDDWWIHVCQEYADNAQADGANNGFPNYFTDITSNGITHGADWYLVNGGRQDYMNFENQAKEVTIELSNIKLPSASLLDDYWFANQEALIEYLIQGTYGFRGLVKDAVSGNPIEATVKIVGHDDLGSWTTSELPLGDYYRPMKAGTYDLVFEAPCYQSITLSGQTISDYQTLSLPDVNLTPIGATPPSGLAASNVDGSSATLSWNEITGATYDCRYKSTSSSTWTTINTSSFSVDLSGLPGGTECEAQVRSVCNSNTSSYSNSVVFNTTNTVLIDGSYFESGLDGWIDGGTDCARYSGANSYEGSYSMRIRDNSGTASSMTSPSYDLSSYDEIEFSFYFYPNSMENGEDFWLRYNDGSGWTTIATYTRGTDFNNGSFYNEVVTLNASQYNLSSNAQFRLQCDASGNNDQIYIDEVLITATASGPDTTPPSTPLNLNADTITQTTVDLSWTASTDNVGVDSYDIYQDGNLVGNAAGTNYQAINLVASTSYSFYVIAKDAIGNESNASASVNVTTLDPPDTTPPSAASNLTASNTTYNSTDLAWNAATDNVAVVGYDVYQNGNFVVQVSGLSYQVSGLNSNTAYAFYVIARDAAGNSSVASNTENIVTDVFVDTEAPTTPTNLSAANITQISMDLSWNASTDNVGVTDYNIYQDNVLVSNTVGTTYQVINLVENTTYAFYVEANDAAANTSGASNTLNETTEAAPTCFDGIQNGDETGIDCGGSTCDPCSGGSTILHQGYFESGFDSWSDGGNDCARVSGTVSYEGSYSIRLRDNSGTSSSMSSPSFNITSYDFLEFDFYFYPKSIENGEDLWLRYNDGSGWTTVATFAGGSDFNNNSFYNATVTLDANATNFSSNAQFRLQADASANNDQLYIDQVTVTGINGTGTAGSTIQLVSSRKVVTESSALIIYPNPVSDAILNVELLGTDKINYKILSMTGQILSSGVTSKEINVSTLKTGFYFIQIQDGEDVLIKKFIKQ